MCKADIAFLLNPATAAPATPERAPASPSASLFESPSPLMTSRRLLAPYMAPLEKQRRCQLRCFGNVSNKRALPAMSMAALCSECFDDDELSDASSSTSASPVAAHPRKAHTPPCQVADCKNLAVSRGLCVRHGGGSKCTEPGCNKRAKLYQRCFQHGGYKMCTEPGCTKKAKRYGHCWSHGGGHICEVPECTKVSTQGGFCWAHGGGNRCKHEGCNRRSYQKNDYFCARHATSTTA
jgi:hypothetical protein